MSDTRTSILSFIRDFINHRGYAPTVREIGDGCGISAPSVIYHHLNMLQKEGYIRRSPNVIRGIHLVEGDNLEIPILGTIAAGEPIPVPDSNAWNATPEEMLGLLEDIVGGKSNLYALRVKGTSMIDAFIDDGDIVVMQHQQSATDGEMVAVWLRDKQEVTLKRIYRERKRIRLQPANQQMEPIYSRPEDVEVQGRVVAVLRKLNQ